MPRVALAPQATRQSVAEKEEKSAEALRIALVRLAASAVSHGARRGRFVVGHNGAAALALRHAGQNASGH